MSAEASRKCLVSEIPGATIKTHQPVTSLYRVDLLPRLMLQSPYKELLGGTGESSSGMHNCSHRGRSRLIRNVPRFCRATSIYCGATIMSGIASKAVIIHAYPSWTIDRVTLIQNLLRAVEMRCHFLIADSRSSNLQKRTRQRIMWDKQAGG